MLYIKLSRVYFRLTVGLLILFIANFAVAADFSWKHAYVRTTPPGAKNAAAYLQLHNQTDKDIVIVSASSKQIPRVEFHAHQQINGAMHMMRVNEILVPAKGSFHFTPGQHHIMLMGLTSPLIVGDSIRLELKRANGEVIEIVLPIKSIDHSINGHTGHGELKQ